MSCSFSAVILCIMMETVILCGVVQSLCLFRFLAAKCICLLYKCVDMHNHSQVLSIVKHCQPNHNPLG